MPESSQVRARPEDIPSGDFVLGDWLVQPSLNRLSRNGTTTHLRPQLVDVLVCLARSAGRPVSRHELLDQVWPNQFVADTALARCVAELRQALGDSATSPTLIETIPKRGYRLIGLLTPVNGNGHGGDAPADLRESGLTAASIGGIEARALLQEPSLVPDAEPCREASLEDLTRVAEPMPAVTGRPGRRTSWWLVASALLSTAALGALMAWWLLGAPWPARPKLAERDPVVLSFANTTGDPVFDDTLRLALAIHLEQSPYVRITPERAVQESLAFLGQPRNAAITPDLALQICQRIGASAVLHGSIAALGQRYVIGLEAVACASRDSIARAQAEAAGKEQVLEALTRAANAIRRDLGESITSVERFDVPLVQASTGSLEALRAVSLGDREKYRGNYSEALQHYRHATALDPDFALAHARLGVTYLNLRRRGEAVAPLTRAFELSGRVTEPERLYIEGHYYNGVLESPLRAIDAFSVLSQTASLGTQARVNLASLYQQVGLWYQAVEEAEQAVRLEPDNAVARVVLAGALTGVGRFGEALETLDEAGRRGLQSPDIHALRYDLAFLSSNQPVMREEDAYAAAEPAMAPFLLFRQANQAMHRGRFREAAELWTQVRASADSRQDVTTASTARLSEAGSRALLGDATGAASAIAAALQVDRSPSRVAQSALIFALAGDARAARRQLAEYDRVVGPGSGRDLEFVTPARAALAVAEGRFGDVAALLEPIRPYELGTRFEYLPSFIRAHALMGLQSYEPAAQAFQVILDNRGVMPYSVFVPLALLGQARAYAALGRAGESLERYRAFLDLWTDADTDLPQLTAARREAAAVRGR